MSSSKSDPSYSGGDSSRLAVALVAMFWREFKIKLNSVETRRSDNRVTNYDVLR